MNKTSAIEWIKKAYHDLKAAQILYDANHYTDSIGVDLHYCIEKQLKAFLAYYNKKIPKSHNLPELYELVNQYINIDDDILYIATKYHIEVSYPQYDRGMPDRKEIKDVLNFSEELFKNICKVLKIEKNEYLNE